MASPTTKVSFSGHETFPLRTTWLKKAYDGVRKEPSAFSDDDAMVRFGVGKNMVRSMRHWALACGILAEDPEATSVQKAALKPTPLGERLFADDGWDPYMEDPATVWLLHWQLASTPQRATTWYYAFNLLPRVEFTKPELVEWLTLWVEGRRVRASANSLRRDVDCFVRTYVPLQPTRTVPLEDTLACPLTELDLIRELRTSGALLLERSERVTLPDELIAFALCEFLKRRSETAHTLALEEIAFAEGSPGHVFALTEEALLHRFERLDRITDGALAFDETAGLRHVIISELPDPLKFLEAYYQRAQTYALASGEAARA